MLKFKIRCYCQGRTPVSASPRFAAWILFCQFQSICCIYPLWHKSVRSSWNFIAGLLSFLVLHSQCQYPTPMLSTILANPPYFSACNCRYGNAARGTARTGYLRQKGGGLILITFWAHHLYFLFILWLSFIVPHHNSTFLKAFLAVMPFLTL